MRVIFHTDEGSVGLVEDEEKGACCVIFVKATFGYEMHGRRAFIPYGSGGVMMLMYAKAQGG